MRHKAIQLPKVKKNKWAEKVTNCCHQFSNKLPAALKQLGIRDFKTKLKNYVKNVINNASLVK